jgi:glutamate 5-kinase
MYRFKRIVVKIGSNVLTQADGTLDLNRIEAIVTDIAQMHKAGIEIILVSSGAVASGRRKQMLPSAQALSRQRPACFFCFPQG